MKESWAVPFWFVVRIDWVDALRVLRYGEFLLFLVIMSSTKSSYC